MINQRKIDDAFINSAITNMSYIYKDQAKQFITTFLNTEPSFRPFDAIRESNGVIITFIELRGFIQIGKNYSHQMVIGLPKNYPQAPPIFLLSVNRALFAINRETQMLANKEISLEMDERGVEFIKFSFHILTAGWKPMTPLLDVFNQFKGVINSPPLLVEVNHSSNRNSVYSGWGKLPVPNSNNNPNQNINNHLVGMNKKGSFQSQPNKNSPASNLNPTLLTQLIDNKSIDLSNSLSTLSTLQQQKEKLQYIQTRNTHLLNDHLKQLHTHLTTKSKQLLSKTEQVSKTKQKSQQKSTCDFYLTMSEKDEQKLERMAERQALKEAEKKVKETLQKELEIGKKYSDYKKVVRGLFAQMFENQSRVLQMAE